MIVDPEHEELAELLGAYALDAVDEDESHRIEEHLHVCPRCRAETDQLRHVAGALGNQVALERAELPEMLWNRIAEQIGAGEPARATVTASRGARAFRTIPMSGRRLDHGRQKLARRRRWVGAVAIAAAAAAAIAALAVGLVQADGRANQLQSALAAKPSDAAVSAALASRGHRVVSLRATTGASVANLVLDPKGVGYVVSSTMSSLPSDETYQLWASIDGRAISLGLLGPRPSSGAAFSLADTVAETHELMVTVEPAGGVVTPDRAPTATARLGPA